MTVICYAVCDGTPVAFLHDSVDEAVLAAERDPVDSRCELLGIEVIPPEEAWADSYIVEANTPEWERLSAEVHAGRTTVSQQSVPESASGLEHPGNLYVRTPSGVWAQVGNDWHGGDPTQALADLVVAVGPYRAKLLQPERGDHTSRESQRPD